MSKKKLVLLVGLIVVVLGATLVAVLVSRSGDDEKNTGSNSQNQTQNQEQDAALLGETFTDSQAGVTMRIPKGWQLAPKSEEGTGSLTRFVQEQGSSATPGNGELTARKSNASLDQIVRAYLEVAMDIDATPKVVSNQDVRLGDKTVRLLSQELNGPNGQNGLITQYIYIKNGTFYVTTFTMLSSDWEAQRPGIEAAIKSLKVE